MPGPFEPLLRALHALRLDAEADGAMRIRTALSPRASAPAHERAVRTLMAWQVEVDEAMFLAVSTRGPFLRSFEPELLSSTIRRGTASRPRRRGRRGTWCTAWRTRTAPGALTGRTGRPARTVRHPLDRSRRPAPVS